MKRFFIPPFLQPAYFPSLDGLRAICIVLVLFSHFCNAYKFPPGVRNVITLTGVLGVQVFFVISGFLITTLLLKEKINAGSISLRAFYERRILRIFPVAMLYLLCMLLMNTVFQLRIPLFDLIGAALFLSNLPNFQRSWYTAHYWSLSIEEQYYLIFPFLLKQFSKKIDLLLGLAIFLIILLRTWAYEFNFPQWPLLRLFGLLVYQSDGVLFDSLLAVICCSNNLPVIFIRRFGIYLLLILPGLIWLFHSNSIGRPFVNPAVTCALISVFIICCIICGITFSTFFSIIEKLRWWESFLLVFTSGNKFSPVQMDGLAALQDCPLISLF